MRSCACAQRAAKLAQSLFFVVERLTVGADLDL
jgi:hypothetical protein